MPLRNKRRLNFWIFTVILGDNQLFIADNLFSI